ncbi:MAG: hypothetical protein AOA66_0278 [Candidatus Bathyarchaeota archaeon BA2]|nr:MAG: hypothetical protein AOA66_0278 [Candidatus Bathyarchaeota archaeon BA2]
MAEEEKIKKIAELRGLLEKRIEDIETELEGLRVLLGFVDDMLIEKGFKRAKIMKPVPTPAETVPEPPAMEYERSIPIKTVAGDLLADLYMEEDSMQIVLAEDKSFDVNTPPFTSFLVDRVLAKMQEKDREAASTGEITPDKIISYNIVRDGDLIREITIRNVRKERLRELKSSIRWTLEKMYEKTMQTT